MQTPGQKWRTDRPRRETRRPAQGKPVGSEAFGKRTRLAAAQATWGRNESSERVRIPPDLIFDCSELIEFLEGLKGDSDGVDC